MKTILTFLIAVLAFASTLAWAGEKPATLQQPAAASASATAPGRTTAPGVKRDQAKGAARSAQPASDYQLDLPASPSVICACVNDKHLG